MCAMCAHTTPHTPTPLCPVSHTGGLCVWCEGRSVVLAPPRSTYPTQVGLQKEGLSCAVPCARCSLPSLGSCWWVRVLWPTVRPWVLLSRAARLTSARPPPRASLTGSWHRAGMVTPTTGLSASTRLSAACDLGHRCLTGTKGTGSV